MSGVLPAAPAHPWSAHSVAGGVQVRTLLTPAGPLVRLSGPMAAESAGRLTELLTSFGRVQPSLHVDLLQVTAVDAGGLQPLIDAAHQRAKDGLPALVVDGVSEAVSNLLRRRGVAWRAGLDPAAWNREDSGPE